MKKNNIVNSFISHFILVAMLCFLVNESRFTAVKHAEKSELTKSTLLVAQDLLAITDEESDSDNGQHLDSFLSSPALVFSHAYTWHILTSSLVKNKHKKPTRLKTPLFIHHRVLII